MAVKMQARQPLIRRLLLLATLLATGGSTALAAGEACQRAGSDQGVVQGRLGLLEGLGPAAFIVTIPAGLCLDGPNKEDNVSDVNAVQLYADTAEGFQDLYRLVGEKVYVRGRLSGARTFQQRTPVIMEVIEIATQ